MREWVPDEAADLVAVGTRFAIQRCLAAPVAGRSERFKRDMKAHMLSSRDVGVFAGETKMPTVFVGKLWRSSSAGDLLLFVE